MKMSSRRLVVFTVSILLVMPVKDAHALGIIEIIKQGITKVIQAVDLKIQREQNKVIWLQSAQKTLENAMSKLKLREIGEWTERQKEQYGKYFEELQKVKLLITYYQRIKDITVKQARLVQEYRTAWGLLKSDKHFSAWEIDYMGKVYNGILNETIKNIDQLTIVINSFKTQMSDAKRLELINSVGDRVDENIMDLRQFNNENALLSLQRAKDEQEINLVKKMYGLE